MSLSRSLSAQSLLRDEEPIGPLSPPSDTTWRRQRLLQIGEEQRSIGETETLRPRMIHNTSYGTLPVSARTKKSHSKLGLRRGLGSLPGLSIPSLSISRPHSPTSGTPHTAHGEHSLFRSRPISAYDKPIGPVRPDTQEEEIDVRTNGIRVWYSSFTSIDWLHDAIKDSARQARLRKRRSKRGRVYRQLDRSVGWIIVTIVGILTAVVAFLIVRSEQLLFDIKEGYCTQGWYKAKRFCCPHYDDIDYIPRQLMPFSVSEDETCSSWRMWAEVFGPAADGSKWIDFEDEVFEYIAYAILAVRICLVILRQVQHSYSVPSPADYGHRIFFIDYSPHRFFVVHNAQRLWRSLRILP